MDYALPLFCRLYENISIGEKFSMMRYSRLAASDGVMRIGDRVSINSHVCIDASDGGRITIGDDVLIGPNAVLRASNHVFSEIGRPINQQGHAGGDIIIEKDVWIAANVVVVPNARIGSHAVVAAGAVVNRDVEPWTVVGGVPARVISQRSSHPELP
jgi:acetyltransferase-like isoleucine patch superfamily enzyme